MMILKMNLPVLWSLTFYNYTYTTSECLEHPDEEEDEEGVEGLYLGSRGPSVMVDRVTLLESGSVSGARLAKMRRMSRCR